MGRNNRRTSLGIYLTLLVVVVGALIWLNHKGKELKNSRPAAIGNPSWNQKTTSPTPDSLPKNQPLPTQKIEDESGQNEKTDKPPTDQQPSVDDFTSVGSLNHQYLQSNSFPRLVVEIDSAESTPGSDNAVSVLISTIKMYADKPRGIIQSGGNKFSTQKAKYTAQDLLELAKQNRSSYSQGDTVSLYILYVNGSFAENEDALGVALNASVFVIFKDRISQATTALVLASEIERAVLIHELGHLLGLVNINYQSSRNHEDSGHPKHANNTNSVMYWAVEDISVANILRGGPPYRFDSDDQYDIEMIKNGTY